MKLTEDQIEKIKNQSYRTQELIETLDNEFNELARSLGLEEDTKCLLRSSALNWLHDAVHNFPPVNLENAESFETCIKVVGERLEDIEKLKAEQSVASTQKSISELQADNEHLRKRIEKLSKRKPTEEEAVAQYHWLKENSSRNK